MQQFSSFSAAVCALLLSASSHAQTVIPEVPRDTTPPATSAIDSSLQQVLTGQEFPLTMKASDLNASWRRVAISVGNQYELYFTQGKTLKVGDETYLIAYLPTAAPVGESNHISPSLTLTMLNMRSVGTLRYVETMIPPPQDRDALQKARNATTDSNLRQLGIALQQYISDHDEMLPPMNDAETAKKAMLPYVKNDSIFVDADGKPLQPNGILSKKKKAHITNPSAMVAFYEGAKAANGTRCLVFLDGRVKRIQEREWPKVVKDSKIPLRSKIVPVAIAPQTKQSALPQPAISTAQNPILTSENKPAYDARLKPGARPFAFEADDIAGKAVSLDKFQDKVLLLHFGALSSQPSRDDWQKIAAAYQKYQARGFEVVSIALDEADERDALLSFAKENNITWPLIHDGKGWNGKLATLYGVRTIPFSLLIARGQIGALNVRGDDLDEAMSEAAYLGLITPEK
jgi:peroxiredoxin